MILLLLISTLFVTQCQSVNSLSQINRRDFAMCFKRPLKVGDVINVKGKIQNGPYSWACNFEQTFLNNVFIHVVSRNFERKTVFSARPGCCASEWQKGDHHDGLPYIGGAHFEARFEVLSQNSIRVTYPSHNGAFGGAVYEQRGAPKLHVNMANMRAIRCYGSLDSVTFEGDILEKRMHRGLGSCPAEFPKNWSPDRPHPQNHSSSHEHGSVTRHPQPHASRDSSSDSDEHGGGNAARTHSPQVGGGKGNAGNNGGAGGGRGGRGNAGAGGNGGHKTIEIIVQNEIFGGGLGAIPIPVPHSIGGSAAPGQAADPTPDPIPATNPQLSGEYLAQLPWTPILPGQPQYVQTQDKNSYWE